MTYLRFLTFFVVLMGLTGWTASTSIAAPIPQYAELSKADRLRLDQQRNMVLRVLKERYKIDSLSTSTSDLPILQRLLNDKVFTKDKTYELQSIGVVFGDVLANELGLHWIIVTDAYGTDPTLRYRDTTIQVNALTMISKRVEDGRAVDLQAILDGVRSYVMQTIKSGSYR